MCSTVTRLRHERRSGRAVNTDAGALSRLLAPLDTTFIPLSFK